MKKPYEELDIEVVRFVSEDVITASGAGCEKDVTPCPYVPTHCPCEEK